MKKKTKTILVGLIMLIITILVVFILYLINTPKYGKNIEIEDDYYALIYHSSSLDSGENIYFYIDGHNNSRIVRTKWHTKSLASTKVEETIIEEKNIGHNENIYNVVREKCNNSYTIIINRNIPETKYRKGYSKGQKITLNELVGLVALN